jgi:hypothetical protein
MSNNANKNYANLTAAEASTFDFTQVMENSADTARWSGDNSECMVHWVGKTPAAVAALKKTVRSHSVEMSAIKNSKSKYITEGTNTAPFLRAKPPGKKK